MIRKELVNIMFSNKWRFLCLVLLAACADSLVAQVSFERNDYAAQSPAAWIATGDFNNDHIPDLIVVNSHSCFHSCGGFSTVSVLLGNGDGTFQAPLTSNEGGYSAGVAAVGDINSDGNLDVVVPDASGLSLLLGNGDGTFQAPTHLAIPFRADFLAIADLNGDGKADLVGIDNSSGFLSTRVFVMLGNGDGSFQSPIFADVGDQGSQQLGRFLAVADLNSDGIADLAVTVSPVCSPQCPGVVVVLLGNGDGTFQDALRYGPLDYATGAVVAVDLNNDGIPDLVITNVGQCPGGACQGSVSVLRGRGDGRFHHPRNFVTKGCGLITVGDFDGDGNMDIAVTNCNPPFSDSVLVLLGNGHGKLGEPISFEVGSLPDSITTADFNLDGQPDLATANTAGYASVLINTTQHP